MLRSDVSKLRRSVSKPKSEVSKLKRIDRKLKSVIRKVKSIVCKLRRNVRKVAGAVRKVKRSHFVISKGVFDQNYDILAVTNQNRKLSEDIFKSALLTLDRRNKDGKIAYFFAFDALRSASNAATSLLMYFFPWLIVVIASSRCSLAFGFSRYPEAPNLRVRRAYSSEM